MAAAGGAKHRSMVRRRWRIHVIDGLAVPIADHAPAAPQAVRATQQLRERVEQRGQLDSRRRPRSRRAALRSLSGALGVW